MSRGKDLVKNTGILAIGKLSAKLFTFLLLPLYTSALQPEDYGTIDVLQTVISLSLYIVTLQIDAAVFRFLIEHRDDAKKQTVYLSCGMLVFFIGSVLFTVVCILINTFWAIPHVALLIAAYWANSFSNIMLNILRGYGHNAMYSIGSTAITLVALVTNVVLIVGFHVGGEAILLALLFSNLVGGVFLFAYEKMWQKIRMTSLDFAAVREMLVYSIPLVPTAVSWWVANMSDRILILAFLGTGANGIYAAANKIPAIYTTIYTIFNMAWTENVTLAMKDADRDAYLNNMMFSSYKLFSFLVLGIICCSSLFFKVLIGVNYWDSYPHIFILLVAVFVNSMCSMYGAIFIGFKDSKTTGITTLIGAVVNFIINIFCIKAIGLYAASVSTVLSYLVILIVRIKAAKKMVKVQIPAGFTIQLVLAFIIVGIAYFINNTLLTLVVLGAVCVWGVMCNKKIVVSIFSGLRNRIRAKG